MTIVDGILMHKYICVNNNYMSYTKNKDNLLTLTYIDNTTIILLLINIQKRRNFKFNKNDEFNIWKTMFLKSKLFGRY